LPDQTDIARPDEGWTSDPQAAAGRDAAAEQRDRDADARDDGLPSQEQHDRQAESDRAFAAADRRAAARDRAEAAKRDEAARTRDLAADARDVAASATERDRPSDQRLAAADRKASALDRKDAARDRDGAAGELRNSYRDDLTGALFRHAGEDQLRRTRARTDRAAETLVIAFLDVDGLKRVNDTEGHESGDHLLHELGIALHTGLRSSDVVVRYGGDEFVCALPGTLLPEAQARFAEIGEALGHAVEGATISVGLVQVLKHEELDQAIGRADRQMYDGRQARCRPGPDLG
jgi:diguanylate cyclase (GGDEF)-like protein